MCLACVGCVCVCVFWVCVRAFAGLYDHAVGVNHGGGKWLNFRGYHGNATDAFVNTSLNALLDSAITRRLSGGER
eukprot:m.504461 g.504461  ORF g.504461 m.504461 type:complete len:75 (+) comp21860_c0_seq8:2673-2897(+)